VIYLKYKSDKLLFNPLFIYLNMVKDKRHKTVKILIEGGHVTDFATIFDHIPKTTVADELGIHFNRFNNIISKVGDMRISDLYLLSGYFEVEPEVMFRLINNQHAATKKTGRKKSKRAE
jgi:hypothetical protein